MSIGALRAANSSNGSVHQTLKARFGAQYQVWQGVLPAVLACGALCLLSTVFMLRRPCGGASMQTVHPTKKPAAKPTAPHARAGSGPEPRLENPGGPLGAAAPARQRIILVHTTFMTPGHATPVMCVVGSCTQGLCALLVGAVDIVFRCAAASLVLEDWAKVGLGPQARRLRPLLLVPAEWWHFVAACLAVALAMMTFVRKDRAVLPRARTSCITAREGSKARGFLGGTAQVVPSGQPHGGAEVELPRPFGAALCDVLLAMWGRGLASVLLLPASYLLLSVFVCGFTGSDLAPSPASAGNGAADAGLLFSVTSRCSTALACFTTWHWVGMVAALALLTSLLFVYGPLSHGHTLDGGLGIAHCLPLTVPARIVLAYAAKVLAHRTPLGALIVGSAVNALLFVCAALVAVPPRRARVLVRAVNAARGWGMAPGLEDTKGGAAGTGTQPARGVGPFVARAVLLATNTVCLVVSAASMALRLVTGTPSTPFASIAAAGAMLMLVAILAWLSYLYLVTPERDTSSAGGGPVTAHERCHLWLYGYTAVPGCPPHHNTFTRIVVGAACPRAPESDITAGSQLDVAAPHAASAQICHPTFDVESPRVVQVGSMQGAWPRIATATGAGAAGAGIGTGIGPCTGARGPVSSAVAAPDVPRCWGADHRAPSPNAALEAPQGMDAVEEAARPQGLDKELADGARAAVRAERNADTVAQFLRRH